MRQIDFALVQRKKSASTYSLVSLRCFRKGCNKTMPGHEMQSASKTSTSCGGINFLHWRVPGFDGQVITLLMVVVILEVPTIWWKPLPGDHPTRWRTTLLLGPQWRSQPGLLELNFKKVDKDPCSQSIAGCKGNVERSLDNKVSI